MAINKTILRKTLCVNGSVGFDEKGNVKLKAYNYNGINKEASDDDLYAVGNALASLMAGDVESIHVTEKDELAEAA